MNPILVASGLGFVPVGNYSALHWCLCTYTYAMAMSDLGFQNCAAKVLLLWYIGKDKCPQWRTLVIKMRLSV